MDASNEKEILIFTICSPFLCEFDKKKNGFPAQQMKLSNTFSDSFVNGTT